MKLSVIVPTYNEAGTLEKVIHKIKNVDIPKEIILVDDCSTDGTRDILKVKLEGIVDRVIYHEKNMGKAAAVRTALAHISGDVVIIQDADLEYNPEEYHNLIKPILDGEADVVYGSRFLSTGTRRASFFWHMVGNKLLTLLTNMVCNITLTDMETCYKMFKSDIIKSIRIEENRFGFEPEITIKTSRMNCRIYEVGVSYYGRGYEQGKKIGWKDGVDALRCIFKYGIWQRVFDDEPFLEKFLRKFRLKRILPYIKSGQVVCDIGCGRHMTLLRRISRIVHKCIGIDKKVPAINYSNIEVKSIELNEKVPLESESIDVVTLLATLEHFEKDTSIIKESERLLKKGGSLLITVPSRKAEFIIKFLAFGMHLVSKEEVLDHKRYYTVDTLRELLVSNNFNSPRIDTFQFGFNIFCYARKD